MNSSNDNFRAEFFENSEMLLSIYDKHLTLIDVNKAFLDTLRFERKDIIGKNINDFSPDCKSSGRYAIYEEVIRTGKTFVTDQLKLHPSLGNIYLRLTAFKVGDGMGISSKNITDLRETIDDLETFIYKTSHDVRAPISTTLGLINMANRELKEKAPEALMYFHMIQQQTEHLDTILTRLLETTKIRQGEKNLHLINFDEEINEVLNSFVTMEGFGKIHFEKNISVETKFYSDKILLGSLFQNLIHNAIKYRNESARNAFVKLNISADEEGATIIVEDNGIGIPEQFQKDVFKMFFRATEKASGSGLGLYTVKHCIKKLNGYINLSSEENIGTTFTLYIPNSMANVQH